MKEINYRIKLTFTEPILGTVPKNRELYTSYVASQVEPEVADAEAATVEEIAEKGWTGFHTRDGVPFLYDYMIKGYFKDACGNLRRVHGTKSSGIRAYKRIIDGLLFVYPREIPLQLPEGAELTPLERPLRASGPQGERVALAKSDTAPAGTTIEFTLTVLGGVSKAQIREWLDYGHYRGIGQWRNASYGRFIYEVDPPL